MALLSSTKASTPASPACFVRLRAKHLFDEIHNVDILDCNAKTHARQSVCDGTSTRISIRESRKTAAIGRRQQVGRDQTDNLGHVRLPSVGPRGTASITKSSRALDAARQNLKRIRAFGREYSTHCARVLQKRWHDAHRRIEFKTEDRAPIQFLRGETLPDNKTSIRVLLFLKASKTEYKGLHHNIYDSPGVARFARSGPGYDGVPAVVGIPLMIFVDDRQMERRARRHSCMEKMDPDPFLGCCNLVSLPGTLTEPAGVRRLQAQAQQQQPRSVSHLPGAVDTPRSSCITRRPDSSGSRRLPDSSLAARR